MADLNTTDSYLREQLTERRERLVSAIAVSHASSNLAQLLGEVDAALERVEAGTFGICEACHETIEKDRLICNPLLRYCLDHLTGEQRSALEQDLELASRLQREMLPKQDTNFCGWEIFHHYKGLGPVSGDYCDVICRDGDGLDLFFALGDASGKGVAASMLMAHLHAIFRTLTASGLPVHEMVARASRIFRESALSPYFATMVCGEASASGEVEICNAGHCPPLLLRDGRATPLQATGMPLGLFAEGHYSSQTVELNPGDSLFLYTDGLSEAKNHTEEEYGESRLAQMVTQSHRLAPRALVGACLEDLDGFLAGAPLADDLTVMVIRRAN
ncbi:MAG: SpoIIE family protein phosphatase [Terriglobia bacterium]